MHVGKVCLAIMYRFSDSAYTTLYVFTCITYSPNPLSLPPATLAQAQDWTSSASLQQYVNEHSHCSIPENFLNIELNCHYNDSSDSSDVTKVDFYVGRCDEPVSVGVHIELYNGEYTDFEYTQSETFHFKDYSFSAILERNATHLAFMVSLY